jgi:four helix bundle protein
MTRKELEDRTLRFALDVMKFVERLRRARSIDVVARQLIRSATSIGANYREATRAESHNDFVHKLNISSKEAAETLYWLELVSEFDTSLDARALVEESHALVRIFTASVKTARQRPRPRSPIADPLCPPNTADQR